MSKLTIIQLNIERDKHIARIAPFLKQEAPDAVLLQEVFERDLEALTEASGAAECFFVPLIFFEGQKQGVAILSKFPFIGEPQAVFYSGAEDVQEFVNKSAEEKHSSMRYALAICDIEKDGQKFRLATTHFTWTPNGEADDFQRTDMKRMLEALAPYGELILTGDFNAPRGKEIWDTLAKRYTDNVPGAYTSSLDPDLHRAGPLPYVVDGIFSTPAYTVENVRMTCGVSDHCALVGTISATH